jgi:hypothetical protein
VGDPILATLPKGRILYRDAESTPFVVLHHVRSNLYFLVEDGWTSESLGVGPFAPDDILRAWRLCNVRVPESCERGPWSWGTHLFRRAPLPSPADTLSRFDPAWLAPSVSVYSTADADKVVNETCCSPPHDEPHVSWGDIPPTQGVDELRRLAARRHADAVDLDVAGLLERAWNAHPSGSPVLKQSTLAVTFVVVDLPPRPGS